MGVPCITLAGGCHAHNVGVSLLTTVGLKQQWIAQDRNEYIKLAVQAASNINMLAKIRLGLRRQMLNSPLCDAEGFVTALEHCYSQLYQRHQKSVKSSKA